MLQTVRVMLVMLESDCGAKWCVRIGRAAQLLQRNPTLLRVYAQQVDWVVKPV